MGSFCARSKRSPYAGSDVVDGSKDDSVMADKRAKKGAKNYYATGGPNKVGLGGLEFLANVLINACWKRSCIVLSQISTYPSDKPPVRHCSQKSNEK